MFVSRRDKSVNSYIIYKPINNLTKLLLETVEYLSTIMDNEQKIFKMYNLRNNI